MDQPTQELQLADERSEDPHDLDLLDRIAEVTTSRDPTVGNLRELYAVDCRLSVPAKVTSYDPLGGPPREVTLERPLPDAP